MSDYNGMKSSAENDHISPNEHNMVGGAPQDRSNRRGVFETLRISMQSPSKKSHGSLKKKIQFRQIKSTFGVVYAVLTRKSAGHFKLCGLNIKPYKENNFEKLK